MEDAQFYSMNFRVKLYGNIKNSFIIMGCNILAWIKLLFQTAPDFVAVGAIPALFFPPPGCVIDAIACHGDELSQ